MVFVKTWDETTPAGSQAINLGDDNIRDFKTAIRERLAVDHEAKASEGADANIGYHNKVTLIDQVSDIAQIAGCTGVYSKTVAGVIELFLILSNGTVVQLTLNGKLNASILEIASQTRGDLLVRGVSTFDRKAIGALATYLRSDGTDPQWSALLYADMIAAGILTPKEYTDVEDSTTSAESTTNAAYQDTTLSVTFTVGKQGLVFANFSGSGNSDSGTGKWAVVVDGTVKAEISHTAGSGDQNLPLPIHWSGVLAAGAHTIKIQIKSDGGGGSTSIKGNVCTARLGISYPT